MKAGPRRRNFEALQQRARAALTSAMPDLAHRAFDIQGARALSFVFEQRSEIGIVEQVGARAGNGEELHSGLSFCDRLKGS